MRVIDILHSPWAIRPDRLIEIGEIYARHLRGEKISRDTIQMIEAQIGKPLANMADSSYEVRDGVAIILVDGVLAKKMNLFMQISGGTSTEILASDFQSALEDPRVKAIILNIDSPGGTVDGTQEMADMVYAAKDKKCIAAYCNGMMASAAYWIGSAAQGGIFISGDTVDIGSIGVVTTHTDYSKAYESRGIKITELTAGKYKRIASEYGPLTESGRSYIQDQLDHIYNVFLSDVGRNRGGLSADQVHEQMADGRIFIGTKSIDAGLVDGVSTLAELIAKLSSGELACKPKKAAKVVPVAAGSRAEETKKEIDAAVPAEERTETIMDVKELKEKHPDIYQAVYSEGEKAGMEKGRTEGAAAELARVKAVKEISMPGHEALVESLMLDGKTSGEQAAVAIVAAEKSKLRKHADDIKEDGKDMKVKPSQDEPGATTNVKTRPEFAAMTPADQQAFIKAGGKLKD